ncbi:MAG: 3,8-cyclase [Desulfovibrionales bacterium]|nr:3,8-cyclase [Desulfovibrionales bacterium]
MDSMETGLVDGRGRRVSYLRLSVTDRCNLACRYCVRENPQFIPHQEILRFEEMQRLVFLAQQLGISKVRLTGGEPLVRKGCIDFVQRLLAVRPALDVRLTTNGSMLAPRLASLALAGFRRVNVSLDTLNAKKFRAITGRDLLGAVLESIHEALRLGVRVKINAVGLRGVNDDELESFLRVAAEHSLDVRFIELMPIGPCTTWTKEHLWPAADILERAKKLAELRPLDRRGPSSGPADVYEIAGGKGRFGVIAPLTDHFCGLCNRLRVTADGRLRTCLFSERTFDLKRALRHPKLGDRSVQRIMQGALKTKPMGSELMAARGPGGYCDSRMSAIGG